MAGNRIAPASLRVIAETLARIPILDIADALLLDVDTGADLD
jgi:hypothetical protein